MPRLSDTYDEKEFCSLDEWEDDLSYIGKKKRKKYNISPEGREARRRTCISNCLSPLMIKNRNKDYHKDPNYRKMTSCLAREQHQIGRGMKYAKVKVVERVNNHCGVITQEDFDKLNG